MAETPVFICRTSTPEGERDYVTLLPPEVMSKHGLIAEAIVGMLTQPLAPAKPDIRPEVFARNGEFVDFMHAFLGREAAKHPGMQAQAKQVKNGWVYIVDQRLPRDAKVEPEDIIGAFQAKDGQIVPGTYAPNPDHRILSQRGFFKLEPIWHQLMVQELVGRSARKA